jgi:hypothetical protein
MSASRGGADTEQVGKFERMVLAFRRLPPERRLAVLAALGLFLTLFLPWYQETVIANGTTALRSASASLTGWGAFSWVEAAVLLVAAGVLVLLFVRAEGSAFHVPGGDGGVIMAAGLWASALILWRMFDKEGTTGHGLYTTTSGIEWGIFIALAVAAFLAYAGSRIRVAHEPEPPLPGEPGSRVESPRRRRGRRGRASATPRPAQRPRRGPDMEADETWIHRPGAAGSGEGPTVRDTRRIRERESSGEPRSSRPLDRRDVEDLDIAEPPTSRFGAPPAAPAGAEPPTERVGEREPPTERVGEPEPPTERVGEPEPPTERVGEPEPLTEQVQRAEPPTERIDEPGPPSEPVSRAESTSGAAERPANPPPRRVKRSDPPTGRVRHADPPAERIRETDPPTERIRDGEPPTEPVEDPEDQLTLRIDRPD